MDVRHIVKYSIALNLQAFISLCTGYCTMKINEQTNQFIKSLDELLVDT